VSSGLEILHAGQQHTGIAGNGATGLQDDLIAALAEPLAERLRIGGRLRRLLVGVADAEPAAQVQVCDLDALLVQPVGQGQHPIQGIEEGRKVGQLRADMAIDADHAQLRHGRRASIDGLRVMDVDAELVLAQAGGDVRMRASVHVGIHAQRDRRLQAQLGGHRGDAIELWFGFDVEAADADRQGTADLLGTLADPGEDHPRRVAAGRQHALQLAHRDDVETGAEPRQHIQHRQVGVGLDREADQMRAPGKGPVEGVPMALQRRARVDVAGGAETLGDIGQWHVFGE
jgi:hypothetical protein